MEKNHPGKQKASRKILEALNANWHKHLASRRPPADKRRKIGKAENARNDSLPALLESLHPVPEGKAICHRGAHNGKSPIRRYLSTILSDCQGSPVAIQIIEIFIFRTDHISTSFLRERGRIRGRFAWSAIDAPPPARECHGRGADNTVSSPRFFAVLEGGSWPFATNGHETGCGCFRGIADLATRPPGRFMGSRPSFWTTPGRALASAAIRAEVRFRAFRT
jgi:hypothetical protein